MSTKEDKEDKKEEEQDFKFDYGTSFQLFNADEFNDEINILFGLAPEWADWNTRTAKRKVLSWTYHNMYDWNTCHPDYEFLLPLLYKILYCANINVPEGHAMMPIQMFINYYENGTKSTPMHKHNCRQLTVSFGTTRVLKVINKEIELSHGQGIMLFREKHGVPKDESEDPRISFNLFFTTDKEARTASVMG